MPSFVDFDTSICGFRFLTLTAESPIIRTYEGGETEEGYKREWQEWRLEEDCIVYESVCDERDCDGTWRTGGVYRCPLDQLAARAATLEDGTVIKVPAWQEAE